MRHETDAAFLRHEPCPACPSSDAFAIYDDGHGFCFSCGHHAWLEGGPARKKKGGNKMAGSLVRDGEIRAIRSRKINADTCKTFGYQCAVVKGKAAQVAPYYDEDGKLVAQKIRWPGKTFAVRGDMSRAMPFGAHAWPKTGRKIVVTEGEIDAMAMSQVQGNKYPVVSLANGAQSARRLMARHREYFTGFDEVVLMFDMDEEGQDAAKEAAEVLIPHTVKIAKLPLKDAGEMLEEGRAEELIDAMWRAKEYRPEGIVAMSDLMDEALKPPERGLSWPFETLTDLTFGMRTGELYALGAGTGIGKTDFITETVAHLVREHGEKVGIFALEQQPKETALRVAGKLLGKPLHVPDVERDPEEVEAAFQEADDKVFMYDSFGANEWDPVRSKMEYLFHNHGVRFFFLDHITALAASMEDERKALDELMADLGALVKRLDVCVTFVSHLATPRGTPHEEGGRVTIRHFRGSRAIGFWSHYIFGLERNQQSDNEAERKTTTFRVLKDRYTGRATGETFFFTYESKTGLLHECGPPDEAEVFGFDNETAGEDDYAF